MPYPGIREMPPFPRPVGTRGCKRPESPQQRVPEFGETATKEGVSAARQLLVLSCWLPVGRGRTLFPLGACGRGGVGWLGRAGWTPVGEKRAPSGTVGRRGGRRQLAVSTLSPPRRSQTACCHRALSSLPLGRWVVSMTASVCTVLSLQRPGLAADAGARKAGGPSGLLRLVGRTVPPTCSR